MTQTALFLCVANSARSQMAEGIARALGPADLRVASAGSAPTGVNPTAVQVLSEIGIDISEHSSKAVGSVDLDGVDTVITLCREEVCAHVEAGTKRLHWPLPDPTAEDDEDKRLQAFREVRDLLRARIAAWLETVR